MKVRHPFTLATRSIPRLALRPENTVLLVQDFQEYFVNPQQGFGEIAQKRGVEREFDSYYLQVSRAKENILDLYTQVKTLKMPVVFTRWAYQEYHEISPLQRAIGALLSTNDPLSSISAPLQVQSEDLLVTKQGLGCFSSDQFEDQLKTRRIENILLTGVMTEFGIRSTALAAIDRGYRVIVVTDACAGITLDSHRIASAEMTFGNIKVRGSREILLSLKKLECEDVILV